MHGLGRFILHLCFRLLDFFFPLVVAEYLQQHVVHQVPCCILSYMPRGYKNKPCVHDVAIQSNFRHSYPLEPESINYAEHVDAPFPKASTPLSSCSDTCHDSPSCLIVCAHSATCRKVSASHSHPGASSALEFLLHSQYKKPAILSQSQLSCS